jgi:NADH dehydrogenase
MISQRLVVLGGTGFVGHALLPQLCRDGHEVLLLSRNLGPHYDRLLPPGVILREVDVYDPDALRAAFTGADAVINLVGILNERGDNGRGFKRAHVDLAKLVVVACQLAGVTRLLQMSSLNAGRGDSHYLKSRGEAEAAVKASGLQWTIFEPSVIFGVGDGLFTRFGKLLQMAPILPLARAGAKLAPVYIGDVVEAFRHCVNDKRTAGEVYELYGPDVFTLMQIAQMSARQLGLRRLVIPLPDFIGRLQGFVCDFVPGKPFSSDNFRSLLTDSVGGIDGLHRLGITPTQVSMVLPDILGNVNDRQTQLARYRARQV